MKKRREISKTPRKEEHSRKVSFSMAMREKISENWVKIRQAMKPKKTRKK